MDMAVRLLLRADEILLFFIAGVGMLMGDGAFFYGAEKLLFPDGLIAFIGVGMLFKTAEGRL